MQYKLFSGLKAKLNLWKRTTREIEHHLVLMS